jgi:hypothetical protein
MIKMVQLVYRKPEVTNAEFRYHWLEEHGPWGAKNLIVDRYVQNHVIKLPGLALPGESDLILPDGVVEYYFYDSEVEKSIRATGQLPRNPKAPQPPEISAGYAKHFDRSKGMYLWVEEHIMKDYP